MIQMCKLGRAVTVSDFYHCGGNGPTTAGGCGVEIYIYNSETKKLINEAQSSINKHVFILAHTSVNTACKH